MLPDYDPALVDRLLAWEARLAEGDRSLDTWAVETLIEDARTAASPVMFYAPRGRVALELALAGGLDLTTRGPTGDTVLFQTDFYDTRAFECAADALAAKDAIDWVNAAGMTALSCQVKFAEVAKARILLERGASPNAVMRNARYGGAPLSVAQQAVLAMSAEADAERLSEELLLLLKAHGLRVTLDEKAVLLVRCISKPRVASWIEQNLSD